MTTSATPPEPGASAVWGMPAPTTPRVEAEPAGLALAALIVGIFAFLGGIIPVYGAVVGITAVVLGVVARRRNQSTRMALNGIILGGVATISSIGFTFLLIALGFNAAA